MAEKESSKATVTSPTELLLAKILAKLEERPTGHADKLAAAYVKAWGAVRHVVKDANNPHFGSDYATLEATMNAIRGPFADNGLALMQAPGSMNEAGDRIRVKWWLFHESGQLIADVTELPIGNKSTAQAAGSAITYARRYQAMALAGIAPKDDDGNEASAPPVQKRGPGRPPKAKEAPQVEPEEPEDEDDGADEPEPEKKPAKKGKTSYAEQKDALLERILACETLEDIEALKQEVIDFNDEEVGQQYILQRKALKALKAAFA